MKKLLFLPLVSLVVSLSVAFNVFLRHNPKFKVGDCVSLGSTKSTYREQILAVHTYDYTVASLNGYNTTNFSIRFIDKKFVKVECPK